MKLVVTVAALLIATGGYAQPIPRIVGNQISGTMNVDAKSGVMTDTATLRFQRGDGETIYTIDFIARHPLNGPLPPSGVVDIVVTEHPVGDDDPDMTVRIDGETVPVVARLRSRRSVVATVSVADFDRIARAGVVVDRTFGTELELGAGQARLLRATADRWLGRVR